VSRARIDTRVAAAEGFNIVHFSHPHSHARHDESDKNPHQVMCIVEIGSFHEATSEKRERRVSGARKNRERRVKKVCWTRSVQARSFIRLVDLRSALTREGDFTSRIA
jgi:hypothetical protein